MSTTVSFETIRAPSAPNAISGWLSMMRGLGAVDALCTSVCDAAADHDDVVILAGLDQRLPQPAVQHQHRREHEHHQRHAARGEQRRQLARPRDCATM